MSMNISSVFRGGASRVMNELLTVNESLRRSVLSLQHCKEGRRGRGCTCVK